MGAPAWPALIEGAATGTGGEAVGDRPRPLPITSDGYGESWSVTSRTGPRC